MKFSHEVFKEWLICNAKDYHLLDDREKSFIKNHSRNLDLESRINGLENLNIENFKDLVNHLAKFSDKIIKLLEEKGLFDVVLYLIEQSKKDRKLHILTVISLNKYNLSKLQKSITPTSYYFMGKESKF